MGSHAGRDTIRGSTIAGDGVPLSYELHAAGNGPRVALLHGLGMDRGMWGDVVSRLDADVLLYDLRGHGRTPLGDGTALSLDMAVDDLVRLLDAAGWDRATLAGWSLGAAVAVATAAARPDAVTGLVLVSATATYGPGGAAFWEGIAARASASGLAVLASELAGRWLSDGFASAHPETAARARHTFATTPADGFAAACALLGSLDLRPLLPMVDAPTDVVVGTDDPATPPVMAEALAGAIPGARLTEVAGARHLLPVERPHEVAEIVDRHLATLAAGTKPKTDQEGAVR